MQNRPESLCLIAGRGAYPLTLAEGAKAAGVRRLFALAFKGETERAISRFADEVVWLRLGQLQRLLDAIAAAGVKHAVMAGQIKPTHLFHVRMDRRMLGLLGRLPRRNADTIFGALGDELRGIGVELLPASLFMEAAMPAAGLLASRAPTDRERADMRLGFRVAKVIGGLDVGQTVVVKEGTVLAVEAFEGTNEAIRRAARLGGAGCVVVKAAKQGHDMRFDIPVVGLHTLKVLRKARVSALAVEAGRTIMLERDKLVAAADRMGLCVLALRDGEDAGECGSDEARKLI